MGWMEPWINEYQRITYGGRGRGLLRRTHTT
jgi:hypothetical protein